MKKYLQYESIDFSQEPSFIRWAKGELKNEDDIDWQAWQREHPEKAEEIFEAKKLVQSIVFKTEKIPHPAEDQIWSKIDSAIVDNKKEPKPIKSRRGILRILPYGIAAALAIFAIANINFDTEYSTALAEVQEITLPDESTVIVNADSKLSFDEKNWDNQREIRLSGEAFFNVKKGSQFIVETDYGTVEVLGTSFNVYARDNNFNVVCETGKVGVNTSNEITILMPNQGVKITNGVHQLNENLNKKASRINWMSGIYLYDEAPFVEVINELERQLDVTIKVDPSLIDESFTGSFDKKDLDTALSEVFWPLGLKYKIDGKSIIVSQ
jgi:ferric-dicitrate binding protein FerR (iron transport regulator)